MSLTLYWGSGSPYAWRCLLALELKRIAFNSKLISFSSKEHKTAEFLHLNPRGKVPVLVDGEVSIWESLAILVYLDRKYPETPIFGHSPLESAKVWQTISEHDAYLGPAVREVVAPFLFGHAFDRDRVLANDEIVLNELRCMQGRLSSAGWLVGSTMSAADIVLFPTIGLIERMLSKSEAQRLQAEPASSTGRSGGLGLARWRDDVPALAHWHQRLADLPGVAATYPPHWGA